MSATYNKPISSLLTLSTNAVISNLKYYINTDLECIIKSLPSFIKNTLLKRFTTSSHFWKDLDLNHVLSLLINSSTDRVDLTSFNVNDDMLEVFKHCKNLRKLYISRVGNCPVTTKGLLNLLPNIPNVNLLILPNCPGMSDIVIEHLVKYCPHLLGIDIGGCKNITDKSLEALAQLENLLFITLSRTNVTNNGIKAILKSKSGPKLKELRMADCFKITDDILIDIVDTCPNLQVLIYHNKLNTSNEQTLCPLEQMGNLKQLIYTVRW